MNVPNHLLYAQCRIQISQGLPMNVPNHLLYVQCRIQISQGLLMNVPNHLLYAQHRIQISQGLPIDVHNHLLYGQRHVQISQGLLIDVPNNLLYFLHTHHHVQKARGSNLMLHIASITFTTRITAYKKQGSLDRCSIQLLLLSACASLRTKSKGLHRYVLHI
jgi:hypothetical protein